MTMRSIHFITFMLTTGLAVFSQEKDTTYWKTNFKTGVTFNQASFSKNWKSGGNNSVSVGGMFIGKADYTKDKADWLSQADLQYGRVKNEGQGVRKSSDKLSLETKYGYKLKNHWNLYSSLNFLSQFDNGYTYFENDSSVKISGFFAPAYITSSWGVEYKPSDKFYLRISPFSPRVTIVNDTTLYKQVSENYGVKPGETTRYEWKAFKINSNYETNLVENISLKADYELFASFDNLSLKSIDHRLDILITAKIYKFLNLTITNNYLYDIDQDKDIQTSLLIGLSILFDYKNN